MSDLEISPKSYAEALEHFGIDTDSYEEGSDPEVEEKAYEIELNKQIMKAESAAEGDR